MPAPVASGWSESPGGACTHWKAPPCHGAHPKQTLAVGDSNRQIVWISDISRRRCYSAMIMLGSDNQGLEALWVRAA